MAIKNVLNSIFKSDNFKLTNIIHLPVCSPFYGGIFFFVVVAPVNLVVHV